MEIIKQIARKAISAMGYELRSLAAKGPEIRFENFLNLAMAYELTFTAGSEMLPPNEYRYKLLARLLGTPPSEAYYIIKALSETRGLLGDVCEFGVAQGETSALIANEIISQKSKKMHLFDSFEGLPKPSSKDLLKDDIFMLGNIGAYEGQMSCPVSMVHSRLKSISFPSERYVIHKGFIEQIIKTDSTLPTKVSFAFVDFDFYEPIRVALDFLHNVIVEGGMIVVDDYNFFSTGAKTAVDEFILEKNKGRNLYESFVPDNRYGCFIILTRKVLD